MKDAEGLARCVPHGPPGAVGGGAGSGQPTGSTHRDRPDRLSGHKTLLYLVDASTGGPVTTGAGAVGAPVNIIVLVSGAGSKADAQPRNRVRSVASAGPS